MRETVRRSSTFAAGRQHNSWEALPILFGVSLASTCRPGPHAANATATPTTTASETTTSAAGTGSTAAVVATASTVSTVATASATPTATLATSPPPIPRRGDYPLLLNPKDARGKYIFKDWQGDKCVVASGKLGPPDAPPPMRPIACPASMHHPSYKRCNRSFLRAKADRSACICSLEQGMAPPPPFVVPCP